MVRRLLNGLLPSDPRTPTPGEAHAVQRPIRYGVPVSPDSGSGRPPGWARTPSAFRLRGSSLFPLSDAAGRRPGSPAPDAPPPHDALARLELPARITALLVVFAPLLDLLFLFSPPLWDSRAWRIGVASTLPGTLTLPTVGALALALLAVVRPGPTARVLALSASGCCAVLAGLAAGVLAAELLPASGLPFGARGSVLWSASMALATALANGAMAWSVAQHVVVPWRGAALPRPRSPGIELLD